MERGAGGYAASFSATGFAECPLLLVTGANHSEDYKNAPAEYARRVVAFAKGLR